jgi:hypothetical protein
MSHWGPQSVTAGLFGVVMVLIGVLGISTIGREFALLARIRRAGVSVTGTVVKHVKGSRVDRPVIRFADQRGRYVEFTPKRAFRSKFVPEGERFFVRYLVDEPEKARLAKEEAQPGSLFVFTLVCLGFLVVGLLLMVGVVPPSAHGAKVRSGPDAKLVILAMSSLVGLCVLGFGSFRIRSVLAMRRDGVTTTGTVVRVFSERAGEGEQRKAVIEFVDTNQRRIQFVANSPSRSAGGPVPVAYWPGRPEQARIASVSRLATSVAVATLFFAVVDGLLLFRT